MAANVIPLPKRGLFRNDFIVRGSRSLHDSIIFNRGGERGRIESRKMNLNKSQDAVRCWNFSLNRIFFFPQQFLNCFFFIPATSVASSDHFIGVYIKNSKQIHDFSKL